ncbi:MFS transporter [Clostridiaceae bacterium HSG29]|nr:MFS transporter [Clostridiaceae bacterium HSG29]
MKKKNLNKYSYYYFIWHGVFLALTMSMIDFNTVFPALVDTLTKQKVVFGVLYSILLGAPYLFNIIFSHYLKHQKFKKKYLLLGIYLRALSFLGMALTVYYFGEKSPNTVIASLFILIFIFSISGGFAGISYADMMGKIFTSKERGKLYATKQFLSSLAAFGGGLLVSKIFSPGKLPYPFNYVVVLFIGFIGLSIASLGFLFIDEAPSEIHEDKKEKFIDYIKSIPSILRADRKFLKFIIIENLASFSLMILPFYMMFAKDIFSIDNSYIGKYLLFQITGTIFSNILWGTISTKFGSKAVVRTCVLGGAAIPLIAIVLSKFGPDVFSVVFLLVGFIISGRRVGFETYLLDIAPQNNTTVYFGIRGSLNIMAAVLPIMGGLFIDVVGYYFTFSIVSLIMIFSFVFFKEK